MNKEQDLLTPPDSTSEDETNTTLDVVTDLISDSTIPAPIRRNMFKALDRLCSALIDVPVGALERRSAEKRAESEARIKIGEEVNAQILQQIKVDPEFSQRASNTFAKRILREQFNLEKIMGFATDILKRKKYNNSANQEGDNESEKTISDDWFNIFEKEACQKSSKEMQERFARVIAGEIMNPGTFSTRAIKLLGEIDSETASIFRIFCSGCVSFDNPRGSGIIYTSIFPKFQPMDSNNFLENYGLSQLMLNNLQEFSLLSAAVDPGHFYSGFSLNLKDSFIGNIEKPSAPFLYANKYFLLKSHNDKDKPDWDFKMPGILLSSVGKELMNIVEPEPIEQLTEDIKEFFSEKQLELVEVEILDDGRAKLKR